LLAETVDGAARLEPAEAEQSQTDLGEAVVGVWHVVSLTLLAILANDLKMLLNVAVNDELTDETTVRLVVLANQQSELHVAPVAVLMRLLNAIAGLRLVPDVARADLRR
jgi:hypothetical protein